MPKLVICYWRGLFNGVCRELDEEMQNAVREYLEKRGVNEELAVFLHGYMANKDRTELLRWLSNIETYVKKQWALLFLYV